MILTPVGLNRLSSDGSNRVRSKSKFVPIGLDFVPDDMPDNLRSPSTDAEQNKKNMEIENGQNRVDGFWDSYADVEKGNTGHGVLI